jgi:hypothetical protein
MLLVGFLLAPLAGAAVFLVYPALLLLFRVVSPDDMGYFRKLRAEGG